MFSWALISEFNVVQFTFDNSELFFSPDFRVVMNAALVAGFFVWEKCFGPTTSVLAQKNEQTPRSCDN